MTYFRLIDDVTIPGRWHLGEIFESERIRNDLNLGYHVAVSEDLTCSITRNGLPLDFCLTSFGVPVATSRLAKVMSHKAGPDLQRLALQIATVQGYDALNSTRMIHCLDEHRSEFAKWRSGDHRSDLIGQYRTVTKLVIDPRQVPVDAHFFRIQGWPVALIISEVVKDAMLAEGCFGAKFLPIGE